MSNNVSLFQTKTLNILMLARHFLLLNLEESLKTLWRENKFTEAGLVLVRIMHVVK